MIFGAISELGVILFFLALNFLLPSGKKRSAKKRPAPQGRAPIGPPAGKQWAKKPASGAGKRPPARQAAKANRRAPERSSVNAEQRAKAAAQGTTTVRPAREGERYTPRLQTLKKSRYADRGITIEVEQLDAETGVRLRPEEARKGILWEAILNRPEL